MIGDILKFIIIGAEIFSEERARYFKKEAEELEQKIIDVENSDFYSKDMEQKGKAEQEIEMKTQALKREYFAEAEKKKGKS